MDRAIRRTRLQEKIDAWRRKERQHSLKSDAVKKARADNERLGLPQPLRRKGVMEMLNNTKNLDRSRRKHIHITLAGEVPADELPDARTIAENETVEALYACVELLQWHLDRLSHLPNPSFNYQNILSQQRLADLVLRMLQVINKGGRL